MRTAIFTGLLLFTVTGCDRMVEVDLTPPARPQGLTVLALDQRAEIDWLPNSEEDLAGYNIWWSDRYDGRYTLLGTTPGTSYVDARVANGETRFYAVSSYDFDENESPLSKDYVTATPRPEGYGVRISDFRNSPADAGYDFSTYSVGLYNDSYTDVFFENDNGKFYLDVWNDTDIQDMGYTAGFDEIVKAPVSGWSPSKSAEAIIGHTYVVWTVDNHFAKIRVKDVNSARIVFDWAYQTAAGVPMLKRTRSGSTERYRLLPNR